MDDVKKIPFPIWVTGVCIGALFIRLFLVSNPGFEADVSFWKSWGLAVRDFGIIKGLPLTNFNYPTPFGYFLSILVHIYSLFANPHDFNDFWRNTNLLFLFISKIPAIIADFGVAGVIIFIGKNAKKLGFPLIPFRWYIVSALVYLVSPISIIDGAWWGQLDSLGVLLFLLAFLSLLYKKSFLAGVIYMIAMMTKLQNMVYGPIFFLLMWQMSGWSGLKKGAIGALLTFGVTNIEFILSRSFGRVIESITGNYDYFPWLSLNAFNPWWIYSGAQGMKGSDKILALGLASAKNVGLYLFTAGYLFAVLYMKPIEWLRGKLSDTSEAIYRFLTAFIVVNGSFFLFQTESHDRYAFPLFIMLLLWAPFLIIKNKQKIAWYIWGYLILTILYFYNLHTALIYNYPTNGIPILSQLTSPALTITVSFIFTGVFLWFLLFLSRSTNLWTYIAPICVFTGLLMMKNLPLFTKSPVFISNMIPTEYKQDYGGRVINMPVNSSAGYKQWTTLSVQYAFYRHGIGTHANGYQLFDIGRLFKSFSFDYGIDTEAGSLGSVTFEVYGDDKKLFASEKIGRYEYPRHAEVDITGVRMLKLVVTDAGDGITDDHANWLNAKLIL